MEIKTESKVTITLVINEDEAKWLSNMSQNYMGNPSDESLKDREIRESFFKATTLVRPSFLTKL